MKTKTVLLAAFLLLSGVIAPSLYSQTFAFRTIAGGSAGFVDGVNSNALFLDPAGVAVDGGGNIYVADQGNNAIREITPLGTNWTVTTIAGGTQGASDGTNTGAQFYAPAGIAIDTNGSLYVSDQYNGTIRKITPTGSNWVVSTIAGSAGIAGDADGTNANAQFSDPAGVSVDGSGNVYVADEFNNAVRKITPSGTNWIVTTIAGGSRGNDDGTNKSAQFSNPSDVAVDASGRIFVADQFNNAIRLITPDGTNWIVSTIAGQTISGRADGTGTNAQFNTPVGVAVDGSDNVYVADLFNDAIRSLTLAGTNWVVTTIGGGSAGTADGTGTNAQFSLPFGVVADAFGDIFVADSQNNAIRLGVSASSPPATGSLQVAVTPLGAVSAGGEWQLDGGPLQTNGATLTGLVPGNHTISFSTVSGFTTPADQIIPVTAHLTTAATGNYTAAIAGAGSLQVNLSPAAAASAGARWQVDGGAFQTTAGIVAGLAAGLHTVAFNDIPGWTTPASQTVTVTNSQTTLVLGNYVLQTGSIQVTILPAMVVTAGAKWRVDGGAFQASGATVSGVSAGLHTIGFNSILGWNTPSNQAVTVTNSLTTGVTNYYSRPGSFPSQLFGMVAAGSEFKFTLNGSAGSNYVIQFSSDLVNWSSLSTNTIPANGSIVISDPGLAAGGNRFYRAVLP